MQYCHGKKYTQIAHIFIYFYKTQEHKLYWSHLIIGIYSLCFVNWPILCLFIEEDTKNTNNLYYCIHQTFAQR